MIGCCFVLFRDVIFILRYEDFRLFVCMNLVIDVGKKDLLFGIRNRFVIIVLFEFCFWVI